MLRRKTCLGVCAALLLPLAATASVAHADSRAACAAELARLTRGRTLGLTLEDGAEIRGQFESLDSAMRTVCLDQPDSTRQCYELSNVAKIRVWERGHLSFDGMFTGFLVGAAIGTGIGLIIANSAERNPSELSDFAGLWIPFGFAIGSATGVVLGTAIPPLRLSEQEVTCVE